MSQQTHTVTLKAVDGVSTVFQRIGQSAQTGATQVATSAQRATQALAQEDAAAQKAAVSTTKLGSASTGAAKGISAIHGAVSGAGFATFLGFLSDAANAAAEDEAAFTRLETAVTATGAAYGTYANGLENAITGAQRLAFSDDAAADALATLTTQTQDAAQAQQLLSVAMDLARGKGIALGTAASIVGKVAQGNTAILQRYGITIDENASSTEALAAIQQRFAGQAEAFSNTQGGAIARVQENLDTLEESIGGALGPMQTWLALLPGLSVGMSAVGAAGGALSTALFGVAEAEEAVAVAGATATPALAAFLAVAAPLLAGAAIGAGIGLLARHIADAGAAADVAGPQIRTLNDSIRDLGTAAEDTSVKTLAQGIISQFQDIQAEADATKDAMDTVFNVPASQVPQGIPTHTGTSVEDQIAAAQRIAQGTNDITDANLRLIPTEEQKARVLQVTNDIVASGSPNRVAFLSEISDLTREMQEGQTTPAEWATAVEATGQAFDNAAPSAGTFAAAADGAAGAMERFLATVTQPGIHAGLSAATSDLINFADQAEAQTARLNALTAPSLASGAGFGATMNGNVTPEATRRAGAEIAAAHQAEADAADEATRAAQEHAAALQSEQDAAVQTADALIGSADSRAQAALRAAEAEDQYATRVADINSGLSDTLSNLEENYGDTVQQIQEQRVEGEQAASDAMKQIAEDRRNLAVDYENDIADVALERQRIVEAANRSSQEAERQFAEQQQQTVEAQAAVRDKLNETTQAAVEKWHEAVQQNIEQQRQIRSDLAAAITDVERAFSESTDQAQQDLQRLAEDHRIAMAGFATDEKRIKQDLQLVLKDPRATAEQKNAAELQARRQLHDLDDQRDAEGLANERKKLDIQEQQQQAAEDAARKEADLRAQARQQQQQADDERAAAQQAYQQAVSQANQQAAQQLASIADQQQSAAEDYQRKQQEISRQEYESLADLDKREQDIIAAAERSYDDLAAKRRATQEDLAKKEQELNQQAAEAEQNYNEQVADAQDAAAKQRMQAQEQYAQATKTDMTELQRLREDGLITEGEYQKIYNDLIEVQELSRKIEEQKELSALRQLDTQEQLLEIELQKAKAAAKGNDEPPDPLDGPPPKRLLGGMARLGTLVGEAGSELAIRGNRMWEVGAGGPEWLNLASGTLIMPHGAAQARMRGMALGGHMSDGMPQVRTERAGRASGASVVNNYGTIVVQVKDEDVGRAIARQLSGRER